MIPEDLWRYILMWRTRVARETQGQSNTEYWKNWLSQKDERKQLGWNVSRKIAELMRIRVDRVESENSRLKRENEKLQAVREMLDEMGLNPSLWHLRQQVKDRLNGNAPQRWKATLKTAQKELDVLSRLMDAS